MSQKTELTHPSLAKADWFAWPETRRLFGVLNAQGHETRAVGGAVRNTLMGRPVSEVDFATTATPDQVTELAQDAGLKVVPTGVDHGTVTVILGTHSFEVTTLRQDVETFGRHANVAYTDDWALDAGRRDFTINALYVSADGDLHDPLGGYGDIAEGHIRFIGDADARISEDYLRILRFFRFNAEYGAPPYDADAVAACLRGRHGLEQLSGERLGAEMLQLLAAPGAGDALAVMFDYGLLVPLLAGVPLIEDVERLAAIDQANGFEPDPVQRLAALAVMVAEDVDRLSRRFRLTNAVTKRLNAASVRTALTGEMSESAAKGQLYRLGETAYRDSVLIAWARSGDGEDHRDWRKLLALPDRWQAPEMPLKGADLVELGFSKGPQIGQALKEIEEGWIAEGFAGSRAALLQAAQDILVRSRNQTGAEAH